jgi:hypothetical protein
MRFLGRSMYPLPPEPLFRLAGPVGLYRLLGSPTPLRNPIELVDRSSTALLPASLHLRKTSFHHSPNKVCNEP